MKKLYSLSLLLVMLFGIGFTANAGVTAKFQWQTPGSVIISVEGEYVSGVGYTKDVVFDGTKNPTATSFDFTSEKSSARVYITPVDTEKFFLINVKYTEKDGKERTATPYNQSTNVYINESNGLSGLTFDVNIVPLVRNDKFTVDVVNGAQFIKAYFSSSNLQLDLSKGKNEIAYNPEIDYNLYISYTNWDYSLMYSLIYNGEELAKENVRSYTIPTITPNSTVTIQKFKEGEEPNLADCDIKFEYPAGMVNAIRSIYDKATGKMYTPDQLVAANNTITVTEGSTVNVNLKVDDYDNFTGKFNGTELTLSNDQFVLSNIKNTTNTFTLTCSERYYAPVLYTAYIMNPEGVAIHPDTEDSEATQLTGGTAFSSDKTFSVKSLDGESTESFVFTSSATKTFSLEAPGKHPLLYIKAKPGYYINTVIATDDERVTQQMSGGVHLLYLDSPEIYIMALPMGETAKIDVKLNGGTPSEYQLLNSDRADSWGNTKANLTLTSDNQTLTFEAGLDNPFTFRGYGKGLSGVYLDGKEVAQIINEGVETGKYTINAYIPTDANDPGYSTLTAYIEGQTPIMSGVTFQLLNDAKAQFLGSTARWTASVGENAVITGTQFTVIPKDPNAVITYKDVVVNGYDATNKAFINGLNERGEYVFNVSGNARTNILSVGPAIEAPNYKPFGTFAAVPGEGEKVRTANEFKLTISGIPADLGAGNWIDGNFDAIGQIAVKKGETTVSTIDIETLDVWADDYGTEYYMTFSLTDRITEDGDYTLYIPQGILYEVYWDNAAGSTVAFNGGYASEEFTTDFTVDSTLPTVFTEYELSPASGSTLGELEALTVIFPDLSNLDMILANATEGPAATITNGTDTYDALITYDWEIVDGRGMLIEALDPANGSTTIALGEGEWTLTIPAGYFNYKGEGNDAITATYTVAAKLEFLAIDPADEAEVRSIEEFNLTLPNLEGTGETMLYPVAREVNGITITDKDGNNTGISVEIGEGSEDMEGHFVFQFLLTPALTEAGEYTLNIPANLFAESAWNEDQETFAPVTNGYKTAAYTASYTINPETPTAFSNYSLDPADGTKLETLSSITLKFNDITVPTPFLLGDEDATITNGEYTFIIEATEEEADDCLTFTLTFTQAGSTADKLSDGTWTLDIPAGYFKLGKESNDAIKATYIVDSNMGITAIEADANGNYTVVGIDGRVILRSADAKELNTLDKGIYIVNGRKVAIKK